MKFNEFIIYSFLFGKIFVFLTLFLVGNLAIYNSLSNKVESRTDWLPTEEQKKVATHEEMHKVDRDLIIVTAIIAGIAAYKIFNRQFRIKRFYLLYIILRGFVEMRAYSTGGMVLSKYFSILIFFLNLVGAYWIFYKAPLEKTTHEAGIKNCIVALSVGLLFGAF